MKDAQVLKEVAELIGACSTCTLTTIDENGLPVYRQMSDHNDGRGGALFLHTSSRTRKVAHLRANSNAGLHYFHFDALRTVYVSAVCTFVNDPKVREQHFRKGLLRYFPAGTSDPNYVLLRFAPRSFVYYPGPESGHAPLLWTPGHPVVALNTD